MDLALSRKKDPQRTRWGLIRDVVVFQLKLAVDAMRDVLLSPVSLAAAALDLLGGGDEPGRNFYGLLGLGRRSEEWIDLFGSAERQSEPEGATSLDALVGNVERLLIKEYERGGVTASAKDAIDRSLDAISRRSREGPENDA